MISVFCLRSSVFSLRSFQKPTPGTSITILLCNQEPLNCPPVNFLKLGLLSARMNSPLTLQAGPRRGFSSVFGLLSSQKKESYKTPKKTPYSLFINLLYKYLRTLICFRSEQFYGLILKKNPEGIYPQKSSDRNIETSESRNHNYQVTCPGLIG